MKYKTSRLAGGFVLFCIKIKLSVKVEGGFPRLWPSKCFRCEFQKWLKTASAGGAHLKLYPMQIRCNEQKRADWKYVFYTENFTARWRFQFRSHRSQSFGESRNNFPASSALLFSFEMGFLEAKKMSSATATRRWVERPKIKSAKVFDGLLISDRHFKLSVRFFLEMRGCNFSSREIAAHVRSNQNKQCAVHHGKCQWVFKAVKSNKSNQQYVIFP